jgi:hypothetical protein
VAIALCVLIWAGVIYGLVCLVDWLLAVVP